MLGAGVSAVLHATHWIFGVCSQAGSRIPLQHPSQGAGLQTGFSLHAWWKSSVAVFMCSKSWHLLHPRLCELPIWEQPLKQSMHKYACLWVSEITGIFLWAGVGRDRFHLYFDASHFFLLSASLSLTNSNFDVKSAYIACITKPRCTEAPGLYCSCGELGTSAVHRKQVF